MEPPPRPEPSLAGANRLVVLGYITALAMPPIGVILAIVVAARHPGGSAKHAPWIILASLIASGVWILILSSGALTATSTSY